MKAARVGQKDSKKGKGKSRPLRKLPDDLQMVDVPVGDELAPPTKRSKKGAIQT
jgi:hypothetical protein